MYTSEEREKIMRCKKTMGDVSRKLPPKTRNLLLGIAGVAPLEARSLLARDLDKRSLNALQNRGMIEVRDIDGLVSLSQKGEAYVSQWRGQSW